VGIKVIWTGHLEVVDPIIRGLLGIGVSPERIVLWDYRQATRKWWQGKKREEDEPILLAREPGDRTYNEFRKRYGVSITGGKYHHREERVGSQLAHFEEILYRCTALHASWDVSCALLNHVPVIRNKTRLIVCDATAPLYHKGPITKHSVFTWKYNGVLASRDPVALDTIGLTILKEKRRREGLPHDFPRSHDQLRNAEKLRLGRHQTEWIEPIKVTVS
jgi:hypothetical protein